MYIQDKVYFIKTLQSSLSPSRASPSLSPLHLTSYPHPHLLTKVAEYADELFERLDNGAHIYFCGLKGMMPGIQDMLAKARRSPLAFNPTLAPSALKPNACPYFNIYLDHNPDRYPLP